MPFDFISPEHFCFKVSPGLRKDLEELSKQLKQIHDEFGIPPQQFVRERRVQNRGFCSTIQQNLLMRLPVSKDSATDSIWQGFLKTPQFSQ